MTPRGHEARYANMHLICMYKVLRLVRYKITNKNAGNFDAALCTSLIQIVGKHIPVSVVFKCKNYRKNCKEKLMVTTSQLSNISIGHIFFN